MVVIPIECSSSKGNWRSACSFINIRMEKRIERGNERIFSFSPSSLFLFRARWPTVMLSHFVSPFLSLSLVLIPMNRIFPFLPSHRNVGKERERRRPMTGHCLFFFLSFPVDVNNRKRLLYSNPTVKQAVNQLGEKRTRRAKQKKKKERK